MNLTTRVRIRIWQSTIASLFSECRPAAVRRFVVAVTVDSFNGKTLGRFFAHISKEVRKTVQPTVADSYSPAPISGIAAHIAVTTSTPHAFPCSIFRRFLALSRKAVRNTELLSPTSAALNIPLFEVARSVIPDCPAVALAAKKATRAVDDGKFAEFIANGNIVSVHQRILSQVRLGGRKGSKALKVMYLQGGRVERRA